MAPRDPYFVVYAGALTAHDRASLEGAGFTVYENGRGATDASWAGDPPGDFTTFQVVRLEAESEEDARRRVVGALAREPVGLRAERARTAS